MKINTVLLLLLIYLCFSQTSTAIEIDSNKNLTGYVSPGFRTAELEFSWRNLIPFTQQTLENFSKGVNKGILFVHSLEPTFQRRTKEELSEEDINIEFIYNYIKYLARRPLIAGSIVAYNDDLRASLPDTFAPLSFILEVPAECIAITSRRDAQTPHDPLVDREYLEDYLINRQPNLTLDALIRLPIHIPFNSDKNKYIADMNEVAILNCAISSNGSVHRPKIVGILYNEKAYTGKFDYGNALENAKLKDVAYEWCQQNHLPFIKPLTIEPITFSDLYTMFLDEWFGKQENHECPWPFDLKDMRFLLNEQQLNTYSLRKPVESLEKYHQKYHCRDKMDYTENALLLERAFYDGDLLKIKSLITASQKMEDINRTNFPNFTNRNEDFNIVELIMRYHMPDKLELIKFLLTHGLNATTTDKYGNTLFYELIRRGEKVIYWELLNEEFINLKDEIEANAGAIFNILCEIVSQKDLELLKLAMHNDVNCDWSNNPRLLLDCQSHSPLFYAVEQNDEQAINILLGNRKIEWRMPSLNKRKDSRHNETYAIMHERL